MQTWNVYIERADTDELARFLGLVRADTMSEALQKASEYYELPSHDLTVIRKEHYPKPHDLMLREPD